MVVLAWSILVVVLVGLALFTRSRTGMLAAAIRDNEERARFLGYSTTMPRALVYAIAALVAAAAGVLQAAYNGYIAPQMFHWTVSGFALIMAIIGGAKFIIGPAVGAVALFYVKDAAGQFAEYWPAIVGVTLVVVTLTMPQGIVGLRSSSLAARSAAMTEFVLEGIGLTRRFGGFVALDGVDIAVRRGEIRGLIGPNGAGKSTLIDVLSGRAKNRGGRVLLNGEDVSDLKPQHRRRRGMARSFQRTNIFPELTVEQQLRVASWAVADADIAEVMRELNLGELAGRPAGDISYGDQRRLDLALSLVGRPSVLLLDEPAAGLTTEESFKLAGILRDLANRWNVTVLLVEHDMQVVFSICDRISVLHLGRTLSEGTCAEIRSNPTVVAAYLGTEA